MKQPDTKKLVLGCLVIMLFMIAYTKVKTGNINPAKENTKGNMVITLPMQESASEMEESADEDSILGPAEPMDVEAALKQPYGLVVELDYVSANRISLHGSFGYMVFSFEEEKNSATLEHAVTFEELGGINMGGAAYTDILAGDGIALIVPGIHNEEIARRRKFLYIEETNEITGGIVAPQWMMEKMSAQDYSDAVEDADRKDALKLALGTSEYKTCKLLYGPVAIPEFSSNTYGFLSADGDNLENLWYGMWNADLGTIVNVPLFQ